MGKRGRKIRQQRKYRIKEHEEKKIALTEQEVMKKKAIKKEMMLKIRQKKNNYTKWLIDTTTEEIMSGGRFDKSKIRERQIEAKLSQLTEELAQTNSQVLLNEDRMNFYMKYDPSKIEKVLGQMQKEEYSFDEEIRKFKFEMKDTIEQINEIIRKEEELSRLITIPEYKEYKQLLSELQNLIQCPIFYSRFTDPQLAPSGMIYDGASIDQLLYRYYKDPFTRARFEENIKREHYLSRDVLCLLQNYAEAKNIDLDEL
ncbi:unnamed protein product [Moneuplotes crassus]|uniref:U-box domain-containing protein n=1 Tax=Euplotes crassus TaxID=5936 RepID=A0AAD1XQE7_EUPCR|nr:unnamed protein product [Moneuplotes crassus]